MSLGRRPEERLRGNDRAESLRNIGRGPRVGLRFPIPGSGNTLRVDGRARAILTPVSQADGRPE